MPLKRRVRFCDLWPDFSPQTFRFTAVLAELGIEIEEVNNDPDYFIFGDFGWENYEYNHAIKLFVTGENSIPDFNLADYAISYAPLHFGDRHFQVGIIDHPIGNPSEAAARRLLASKDRFCNFIYRNHAGRTADSTREAFFQQLSAYKRVDAPGEACNNMPNEVPKEAGWPVQRDFMRRYKFTIAFENSSQSGYTTEKLIAAYMADTVPIYWGNPDVTRYFDSRSFINCHNFHDFDSVVERVEEIDADDELYVRYLSANRTRDLGPHRRQALREFLANVFLTPIEQARRRTLFGRQGSMPLHRLLVLNDPALPRRLDPSQDPFR
jgi:hypothetical protein